jgi:hypothetical protein
VSTIPGAVHLATHDREVGPSDLRMASLPHVTTGPTEAVNNLAKRIQRVAFGIVNFRHHRVRCLLFASKPDGTLLPTIQP